MSHGSASPASARERLSALADGELEPSAVAAACAVWKDDAEMRAAWHGYQLIGDVLRSEDLATPPSRDCAFMASLRTRLAAEPVVLAPEPIVSAPLDAQPSRDSRSRVARGWRVPSAIAAGFVVVAGALLVSRAPTPAVESPSGVIAGVAPAPMGLTPGVVDVSVGLPMRDLPAPTGTPTIVELRQPAVTAPAAGRVLRDAQLDRYLAAHKQFAGSALAMPVGLLRPAPAREAPGR